MDQFIASIEKNVFEEVRFQIKGFKGRHLVDIRVFAGTKEWGDKVPTGKGVSIDASGFANLKNAILEVEQALHKRQLIGE